MTGIPRNVDLDLSSLLMTGVIAPERLILSQFGFVAEAAIDGMASEPEWLSRGKKIPGLAGENQGEIIQTPEEPRANAILTS
jgi:hypothetical protein